jgi:2-oxoglutarate dehydrogenase E1 component
MNLEASARKTWQSLHRLWNEWLGFEQVTDVQMLEKVDTSYSKLG